MRLIRLHYPGVILGLYAKEELEDMSTVDGEIVSTARDVSSVESKLLAAKPVGVVDHVGDGTITWQSEIAGCETVADVERVRSAWSKLITHDDEIDEFELAANLRIKAISDGQA